MSTETKAELSARLEQAVRAALEDGSFTNPDGWRLEGTTVVAPRGGDARLEENQAPALRFELPDRVLILAVMPTDPTKEAFRRTTHYDVLYLSSKSPTGDTMDIYQRDRDMIDRFAAWVEEWDPAPPPAEGEGTESGAESGADASSESEPTQA